MNKPWTVLSFPKHYPMYVRRKGRPAGASLVVSFCDAGVAVLHDDKKIGWIAWFELFVSCEQWDGSVCGMAK